MRSYPTDFAFPGDETSPHALNHELNDAVASFHTLDTWNFDDQVVQVAKVELGGWGKLETFGHTAVNVPQLQTGATSQDVYPVRTASDVPWVIEIETGDADLELSMGISWSGVTACSLWFGLKVDGRIVAQTGPSALARTVAQPDLHCRWPVNAGTHRIEPVWGINTGDDQTLGTTQDVEFYDRVVTVREVAR